MQLTFLGTGTCVPSLKRSGPSLYIKIGSTQILIDCGSGTLIQLEKAGLTYRDIDMVLISHYHNDHISDLNALIHALIWTPNFERKKDLILIGPLGFAEFYSKYILPISGDPKHNTFKIIIKEIETALDFGEFRVEAIKTIHANPSLAYKFTEKRKWVVISGDTDFDENLITFSKNSDILILECSYDNNSKVAGHLIPKECGDIANRAGVARLVLTHIYPTGSEVSRLNQTKEIFKNTILAEDLMVLNV